MREIVVQSALAPYVMDPRVLVGAVSKEADLK